MIGSIRLGKILGIEISLDYSWFLVFFLFAWILSVQFFPGLEFGTGMSWVLGIAAALLLFVSVLIHEICHSLVARRYGIDVSGITLFIFGGMAQIKGEPREPKQEFFIAAVGPVVSFAIGFACLGIAWLVTSGGQIGPVGALLGYLGSINIILALFNLIPGLPLDGGRIFRSAVWHFTGNLKKATRWASRAGQGLAWLLMGYGLIYLVLIRGDLGGLWLVFIGWFLNTAAQSSYQQLLLRRALNGVPVADVMERDVPAVEAGTPISDFVNNYLLRYDYVTYPVARDGAFAGVVTLEDVRKMDREAWETTSVGAVARAPEEEQVADIHEDAWDALTRMMESDAQRLLVMRDGELIGAVSRDAISRLVQRKMRLGLEEAAPEERSSRVSASRTRGLGT